MLKKIIRRLYLSLQTLSRKIREKTKTIQVFLLRNHIILSDFNRKTNKKKVNIHYWKLDKDRENLGDYLSVIVCNHLAPRTTVRGGYRHLYAIGSILGFGCQNAVVWGSGILEPYSLYLDRIRMAKLDIRCVRGPKSRELLLKLGKECPKVFGDPAILMPYIYQPERKEKKYSISIIRHHSKNSQGNNGLHIINMVTTDYQYVISEIVQSEKIISSSLHGIILAETYGIPAVLLLEKGKNLFKYEDWYFSTGRFDVMVAHTIEEALQLEAMPLPELSDMQRAVIEAFPKDLWQ